MPESWILKLEKRFLSSVFIVFYHRWIIILWVLFDKTHSMMTRAMSLFPTLLVFYKRMTSDPWRPVAHQSFLFIHDSVSTGLELDRKFFDDFKTIHERVHSSYCLGKENNRKYISKKNSSLSFMYNIRLYIWNFNTVPDHCYEWRWIGKGLGKQCQTVTSFHYNTIVRRLAFRRSSGISYEGKWKVTLWLVPDTGHRKRRGYTCTQRGIIRAKSVYRNIFIIVCLRSYMQDSQKQTRRSTRTTRYSSIIDTRCSHAWYEAKITWRQCLLLSLQLSY